MKTWGKKYNSTRAVALDFMPGLQPYLLHTHHGLLIYMNQLWLVGNTAYTKMAAVRVLVVRIRVTDGRLHDAVSAY